MRIAIAGCTLLMTALCLIAGGPAVADDKAAYPNMAPVGEYMYPKQADEIALARTAAPKSVSDHATVLVLTRSGYEPAVKGSNGFTCLIERSWAKDFDDPEFWDPKNKTPQCWNAAAVRSVLPEYLKRTQWVLTGVSKAEMLARTKAAWAAHEFNLPAPQSVAFMMSKDQYINDPHPGAPSNWHPHVMFFVPAAEASTWGANVPGSPIFSTTSDVDPITTFFVIAPKWSDGSFDSYVGAPAAATGKRQTAHHR